MTPLISLCIPAYKNVAYLKVLLASIENQTFKNYEIIITDDSPNNDVEKIAIEFAVRMPITYKKNIPAKGSPGNWNAGIALAKGEWIKIMHDDDWFASSESLTEYALAIDNNPQASFIFTQFCDYENGVLKQINRISKQTLNRIIKNPLYLFKKNFIGNPSNVLLKNKLSEYYDEKLKWVVDFEFYIRCLQKLEIAYIPKVLINIGYNNDQITKAVFRNRQVEIPENIYMLNKLGLTVLKNIIVFDYYWRLFRNLDIRHIEEVEESIEGNHLPHELKSMLAFQFKIPLRILKIGVFSKTFMFIAYIRSLCYKK